MDGSWPAGELREGCRLESSWTLLEAPWQQSESLGRLWGTSEWSVEGSWPLGTAGIPSFGISSDPLGGVLGVSQRFPGALPRPLWHPPRQCRGPLGASCGHLGDLGPSRSSLWALLGGIWGSVGAVLGSLEALLGRLGAFWGRLGAFLGRLRALLGPSWAV